MKEQICRRRRRKLWKDSKPLLKTTKKT